MKFISICAIVASTNALKVAEPVRVVNGGPIGSGNCLAPLEISQKELNIQLDFFSRSFSKTHYDNAMKIYNDMIGNGPLPIISGVHSWKLYDGAF